MIHERRPDLRHLFGTTLGNHIGNFRFSVEPMVFALLAREGIRFAADKFDSKPLSVLAEHTPMLAMALVFNLNSLVEMTTYNANNDLLGDMAMGIFATGLTYFAMECGSQMTRRNWQKWSPRVKQFFVQHIHSRQKQPINS